MIAWPEANAFVLQRQPYRESSWLVRLLTPYRGQVRVIWRLDTPVYLFQPYACEWSTHRSSVSLRDVQFAGSVLHLKGHTTYLGLYLNELCGYLAPGEISEPALFGSYYAALKALQHSNDPEPHLRYFELSLLRSLGQAPDFHRDKDGHRISPAVNYRFDGVNRFVRADTGMGYTVTGDQIHALAMQQFENHSLRRLIRGILSQALAYQLSGRPLRSRELLRPADSEVTS